MNGITVNKIPKLQIILAFAAIYLIWGSTFLGIKYATETMPPLLMAGLRFTISGLLLYGWVRLRGLAVRPSWQQWRTTALIGVLLFLCGNGSVVIAEQRIPSALAALLAASIPLWVVVLDWLRRDGSRPSLPVLAGLVLGLAALTLLVSPDQLIGGGQTDTKAALILVGGSICWAYGSLYSRRAALPTTPLLSTAMQMLTGGIALLLAGLLHGESNQVVLTAISLRSILSLIYLISFGSLIAFTAYAWLLRTVSPARVATYAYVNPIVAMFCGALFGGETVTMKMMVAVVMIIVAVISINTAKARQQAIATPLRVAEAGD